MREEQETLYEQQKDAVRKEVSETVAEGVSKAIISLVPFIGELINSTLPNIYSASKKTQFNDFIHGLSIRLQQQRFTEAENEELVRKLANFETYKYMSTIIDSVFFSKSSRARVILGIITAIYLSSDSIPYEDLVIISALKDLLDDEISIFKDIYKVAIGGGKEETNGEGAFYISYFPNNVLVNTTFSKIMSLNIIGSKADWLTSKSPASWHGNVTSITRKLIYYINMADKGNDK